MSILLVYEFSSWIVNPSPFFPNRCVYLCWHTEKNFKKVKALTWTLEYYPFLWYWPVPSRSDLLRQLTLDTWVTFFILLQLFPIKIKTGTDTTVGRNFILYCYHNFVYLIPLPIDSDQSTLISHMRHLVKQPGYINDLINKLKSN